MNENDFMTIKEFGSLLRVSRSTMDRLPKSDKNFPKPYKIGIKKIWKRSDVEEYLKKARERSDIEEGLEKTWK